jgi:predicted TIM-barrel fold metal-dependent hydrolase
MSNVIKVQNRESNKEFWTEANQIVRNLGKEYGIEKILYGSGYPVTEPNIVVSNKDAITTSEIGYDVFIYPNGNFGYKDEYKYYSIQ